MSRFAAYQNWLQLWIYNLGRDHTCKTKLDLHIKLINACDFEIHFGDSWKDREIIGQQEHNYK